MKRYVFTMLVTAASVLAASSQETTYRILHECDTTVKAKIEGISLGSRDVHYIIYD